MALLQGWLLNLLMSLVFVSGRPPLEGWGDLLEGLQSGSPPAQQPAPVNPSTITPTSTSSSQPDPLRPPIPNVPNSGPNLPTWKRNLMTSSSSLGSSLSADSVQIPNQRPVPIPNAGFSDATQPIMPPRIPNQQLKKALRPGVLDFSYEDSLRFKNRLKGRQAQFPPHPLQSQFPPLSARMMPRASSNLIHLQKNYSAIPNMARVNPRKLPYPPLQGRPCETSSGILGKCSSWQNCKVAGGEPFPHTGHCHGPFRPHCCAFREGCGTTSAQEVTQFISPGYPDLSATDFSGNADCTMEVKVNPGVCQLRLDFLDFQLPPPRNGVCGEDDRLLITANKREAFIPIPELCGNVAKPSDAGAAASTEPPHIYVHFEDRHPERPDNTVPNWQKVRAVHLNMKNRNQAKWDIRVTQIPCDGSNLLQAPAGCGQYFTARSGNISSLNWKDGTYPKNANIASCIKPDLGACAIQYNLKGMGVGKFTGNKLGYGLACSDHLAFHGEKTGVCGSVVRPREMTLPSTSLPGFTFSSDDVQYEKQDIGYSISYRMLRGETCQDVQFFKYPTPMSSRTYSSLYKICDQSDLK